jgi:hypothetical protein
MRFSDLYLTALYRMSEAGGVEALVERTIREINNPTEEGLTDYLHALTPPQVPCGVCGLSFDVSKTLPLPTLETPVLCTNCPTPSSS